MVQVGVQHFTVILSDSWSEWRIPTQANHPSSRHFLLLSLSHLWNQQLRFPRHHLSDHRIDHQANHHLVLVADSRLAIVSTFERKEHQCPSSLQSQIPVELGFCHWGTPFASIRASFHQAYPQSWDSIWVDLAFGGLWLLQIRFWVILRLELNVLQSWIYLLSLGQSQPTEDHHRLLHPHNFDCYRIPASLQMVADFCCMLRLAAKVL